MKEVMQVTVGKFYPVEAAKFGGGQQQGGQITTDKGTFKCYNEGPSWFGQSDENQIREVQGEWRQTKSGKNPGTWYLACGYGNHAQQNAPQSPQGPPVNNQPQGQPPANQPTYTPVPPTKERDFDKEAHGKCFTLLMAARLQGGADPLFVSCDSQTKTAIADIATDCMNSYDFRTDDIPI